MPRLVDPSRTDLGVPNALFADATAEGLVRFDAAGQIEPGLAERWIVIDGGMSYIFRLRTARWADGGDVTSEQVARILEARIAPRGGNPLAPFLTAIDEIVPMTPQVLEIRLKRPRPDLLKLFAQPALALWPSRTKGGAGPMRVAMAGRSPLLRPVRDPLDADGDGPATPRPEDDVRLIGERTARAIVRFRGGEADLVAGGTFVDRPLVGLADLPPADIRSDPTAGLFGFVVASRDGFLADAANRDAVSAAIDRGALVAAIAPDWDPAERLLPEQLDSGTAPAAPGWVQLTLDQRRANARARVAAWAGGPVRLRIALPPGPGATIVFASVASSLATIGIASERVGTDDAADLRLIDWVAPYDSARWYLATACAPCGEVPQAMLTAARDAPTLAERSRLIAAADIALRDDAAFIPIARPLRWSLVAPRLTQWRANTRAWHPLNRLRGDTN